MSPTPLPTILSSISFSPHLSRLNLPLSLLSSPSTHFWSYYIHLNLMGVFMFLQGYWLIRYGEKSRLWRIAIWPLGCWEIMNLWLGYRFGTPGLNIINFPIGCGAVYSLIRTTDLAFTHHSPIRLPPLPPKKRSDIKDAIHLLCSPRMVGWSGGTALAAPPIDNNSTKSLTSSPRHQKQSSPKKIDGLSQPRLPYESRYQQSHILYHLVSSLRYFLVLDLTVFLLHHFFNETIGNVSGGSLAVAQENFLSHPTTQHCLSLISDSTPNWIPSFIPLQIFTLLFQLCIRYTTGLAAYSALAMGFHGAAFVGLSLGAGTWQEWPRFVEGAWKADSHFDFWGKRWHQLFRQAFLAPSRLFPPHYRPFLTPFFAFLLSALMHDFGQLTLAGHTSQNFRTTQFFLLAAVGMTAEGIFKQITGKRVGGWYGWIWFWSYMLLISGRLVEEWLDVGIAGADFYSRRFSLARLVYEGLTGTEMNDNGPGMALRNKQAW